MSPSSPEQRVFASVLDWSKLSKGTNFAVITFTATGAKQPPLKVTVNFNAVKPSLPGDFKGT
jgi:hypothetical protein